MTVAHERTLVHPVVAPVGDRFRYLDHYVYDALLEAIVQGRLAPGTRLVLDDLADQLKVSRTPIRDALRRLASEGLVHRSGRQGFTVVSVSREELAELYEVRLMCELFAVEYGIANATPSLVDKMAMTAAEGFRELRKGNSFAASLKDRQFHQLVVSLGQNRKLTSLFEPLNIHIQTLRVRPAQEKLSNRDSTIRRSTLPLSRRSGRTTLPRPRTPCGSTFWPRGIEPWQHWTSRRTVARTLPERHSWLTAVAMAASMNPP